MSSGLVLGRRPLGTVLHSSNEPGELSQWLWLCHDDSTISIVVIIIVIIINRADRQSVTSNLVIQANELEMAVVQQQQRAAPWQQQEGSEDEDVQEHAVAQLMYLALPSTTRQQ